MENEYSKTFSKFVAYYPVSHALVRGLESILFSEQKLARPILDIGCGDGTFALLTFGKGKIDCGLDKNEIQARKAKAIGVYKEVTVSSVVKTPFKNGEFSTVISNSVFEHLEDLDGALKEVYRVIKKGGIFVFTVPNKSELKYWFWPKIFGRYYLRIFEKVTNHVSWYDKDIWISKIRKAGFSKINVIGYAPKKTVTLLDFLVPFEIFYHLTHRVTGPRELLSKIFLPFFNLDKNSGLGYYFRVRK